MIDGLRRLKASPFYRAWHFEIGIAILFVGLVLVAFGLFQATSEVDRQAQLGAQTHEAVCAYRADLRHRVHESEQFLRMSLRERIARFGPLLGSIPPATIRAGLVNQKLSVETLGSLKC